MGIMVGIINRISPLGPLLRDSGLDMVDILVMSTV